MRVSSSCRDIIDPFFVLTTDIRECKMLPLEISCLISRHVDCCWSYSRISTAFGLRRDRCPITRKMWSQISVPYPRIAGNKDRADSIIVCWFKGLLYPTKILRLECFYYCNGTSWKIQRDDDLPALL